MNAALQCVEERSNQYLSALALDTIRNIVDHEPTVASTYCDKLLAMLNNVGEINSVDLLRQRHVVVSCFFI